MEDICALETELSDLYSTRSEAKKRLLVLVDLEVDSEDRAALLVRRAHALSLTPTGVEYGP